VTAATRADFYDWVIHALCRAIPDDSTWHPEHQSRITTRIAKRICNGPDPEKHPEQACPVRAQCLAYALANGEHGIWGGMDDRERRVEAEKRKARGKKAQGPPLAARATHRKLRAV
jgi:hypothetical protein